MIQTQADAKRFFVVKVVAEAKAQGLELSDAEQRMLSWSESDPDFTPDPALAERLAAEISDAEYESKIARLLAGAFQRDIAVGGAAAKESYREAYAVLKQGDHYLLVMIDRALGRRLRPWWRFSIS